ncbi:MAG: PQQ-binding-like beta-propeller repeat protein [Planctomycetes bacterium]|nr:PQQ-binding-like beta-propeller repeat protein [Planctomycetota bacterium]
MPNGNTLIADTVGDRVVEVSPQKEIVWKLTDVRPYDVERLANGNTLVCDQRSKRERVVEFDPSGKVVWEYPTPNSPFDADRLANGNTLITERNKHRVIEVDRDGNIVFQIDNLNAPSDADRLPNGHTLIAENGAVREFDRQGRQCWMRAVAWAVEVNRY